MVEQLGKPRIDVNILNNATTYYLSAVAVAIGFKMNLFNIGVDGQYRLAAMIAAAVGGAVALPPVLHITLIIVVAMLVGAFWAGIAGLLKVTRGVSEVISTIMLNFIATGLVAFLLSPDRLAVSVAGSNNIGTKPTRPVRADARAADHPGHARTWCSGCSSWPCSSASATGSCSTAPGSAST